MDLFIFVLSPRSLPFFWFYFIDLSFVFGIIREIERISLKESYFCEVLVQVYFGLGSVLLQLLPLFLVMGILVIVNSSMKRLNVISTEISIIFQLQLLPLVLGDWWIMADRTQHWPTSKSCNNNSRISKIRYDGLLKMQICIFFCKIYRTYWK